MSSIHHTRSISRADVTVDSCSVSNQKKLKTKLGIGSVYLDGSPAKATAPKYHEHSFVIEGNEFTLFVPNWKHKLGVFNIGHVYQGNTPLSGENRKEFFQALRRHGKVGDYLHQIEAKMAAKLEAKVQQRDTDGDGIVDLDDQCVDVPGVLDYQGCLIPDTDGDTILDPDDDCRETPGAREFQGCPIPDTDQDGILDTSDACIQEAEVRNSVSDEDGCPDEPPSFKELKDQKILYNADYTHLELLMAVAAKEFAASGSLAKVERSNPNYKTVMNDRALLIQAIKDAFKSAVMAFSENTQSTEQLNYPSRRQMRNYALQIIDLEVKLDISKADVGELAEYTVSLLNKEDVSFIWFGDPK